MMQLGTNTKWNHITMQMGVLCSTLSSKWAYCCTSIVMQIGGVSQYFAQVSRSGVDVTL